MVVLIGLLLWISNNPIFNFSERRVKSDIKPLSSLMTKIACARL